ncbi:hypothetical protein OIU35_23785 [Boseaceae bacterium BT-24-1]|nr:hypothetical protein [Boseaceae bacterium BT-24-1]
MDMSSLLPIVKVATQVATPLSLAGLALSLFFGAVFALLRGINLKAILPDASAKIVLRIFFYGFVLSLSALILGVLSWVLSNMVERSIARSNIERSFYDKNYQSVIFKAELYIKDNPYDDRVRHQLGTSYYALAQYQKGVQIYSEMNQLYSNEASCEQNKSAATSSLAAFHMKLNDYDKALNFSSSTLECSNVTDMFILNHLQILSEKERDVHEEFKNLKYKFKSSYFQSKFHLLAYVSSLKRVGKNDPVIFLDLKEAFCEDQKVKSIIQARFNTGDFSYSDAVVNDFDYEMTIIQKYISIDERNHIINELISSGCSK